MTIPGGHRIESLIHKSCVQLLPGCHRLPDARRFRLRQSPELVDVGQQGRQ